jgi:hypothetical protein
MSKEAPVSPPEGTLRGQGRGFTLPLNTYTRSLRGIYVDMYAPSEISEARDEDVKLTASVIPETGTWR